MMEYSNITLGLNALTEKNINEMKYNIKRVNMKDNYRKLKIKKIKNDVNQIKNYSLSKELSGEIKKVEALD